MHRLRLLLPVAIAFLSSAVFAHWTSEVPRPDWARRGYCQWGHGANVDGKINWLVSGFGVDVPNANLLLYCNRNLQQTVAYLSDEARLIGEGAGIKRQPYICSKTIWWRREFPSAPQLERCTVVKADGTRVLLYNNPERYGGCYASPIWLQYMKDRVDAMMTHQDQGAIHSIFFDNASNYDCYCPDCRERFRQWTREKYGQELDLAALDQQPDGRFLKQYFDADVAVEFFRNVKAYIAAKYSPDILISPNIGIGYGWADYLVNRGATDLVMIEEGFTLPPDSSTVLKYKLGLAASHGKTTGQLLGLSQLLRRERALLLDASNEMGIRESFVYPEEHKLALAEAAATGGTDIVSFALREQKITANEAPYQVQMRDAIHQYTEFQKQHLPWWDMAQPGAKVAVVHSLMTQLQERSPVVLREVCEALGRAGVPYEILIEEDLTSEQLAACQLLIFPRVRLLSREHCAAVQAYLERGGAAIRLGDLASSDELGRPYPATDRPEIARGEPGQSRLLGRGKLWYSDQPKLQEMKPAELVQALEAVSGPLECRVQTTAPRLFANLLKSADGKTRTVHLVNSACTYDVQPSQDLRDDGGTPSARSFLADTRPRLKKVLLVPDLAAARGFHLRFFGSTCGSASDKFSLVVAVNGQTVKTFRGSELNAGGWFEAPLPEGLLRSENEVIFQATGAPNNHPEWFALRLDTSTDQGRSYWSADEGKTWTRDDLSPDGGVQKGEFMVRFGPPGDPDKLAKPEDFMGKMHVQPARDVQVMVKGGANRPARLCSPDSREVTVQPTLQGPYVVYRIPEVYLYSVLVLP